MPAKSFYIECNHGYTLIKDTKKYWKDNDVNKRSKHWQHVSENLLNQADNHYVEQILNRQIPNIIKWSEVDRKFYVNHLPTFWKRLKDGRFKIFQESTFNCDVTDEDPFTNSSGDICIETNGEINEIFFCQACDAPTQFELDDEGELCNKCYFGNEDE